MLQALVQRGDRLDRVDLVDRLVGAEGDDPREAQREPRPVAVRADDHVERDLDDDGRLDHVVAPVAGDRVVLEPARHLGDLGVGQPAVGLADVDQPVVVGVADGEGVIAQDAVALAVADLDADDDAIDGGQRLLHLQPAEAAPAGGVDALRILDHQALVAAAARIGEGGLDRVDVGGGDQVRAGEPAAIGRERELEGVEPGAPLGQREAQQRLDRLPAARPDRQRIEGDEDDRDLGLDRGRRRLAPEPALERDERQDRPVAPAEDLAVEDAVPRQPGRRLDDLRVAAADVVQVARVEADLRAALVELRSGCRRTCPRPRPRDRGG